MSRKSASRFKAKNRRPPKVAASESPTTNTALRSTVSILMFAAAMAAFLFVFPDTATILLKGKLCSRHGCRSWSETPWGLSFELLGYLLILLISGGLAVSIFMAWVKPPRPNP